MTDQACTGIHPEDRVNRLPCQHTYIKHYDYGKRRSRAREW